MRLSGKLSRWGVVALLSICGAKAAPKVPSAKTLPPDPPNLQQDLQARSPQDEMAAIHLPPGYHLELVASDPDIVSPVLCRWDGDGRMYVAEMRSYMLNINGTEEMTHTSRVSRWVDTKGDGVYDKHTIFADNLLLPRMVLPLDNRILVRETNTKDIYSYRDTTGNGVADEKKLFYEGGPRGGNLEHQPSGLLWDIDNWVYQTAESERFRYKDGKFEMGKLPFGTGQWGIAMDNTGRLIFASAGAENPAHDFQAPLIYGRIPLPGEQSPDFTEVFPFLRLDDVQGGLGRLYPDGGLNHFTACAGPSVYRGEALPKDLEGNYIVPEPVGRLIRRAKLTVKGGEATVSNYYDHKEFITSADANFRPVWTDTGPDGCMYIVDMYHGIIQESAWTKPGSFLRPQIQRYGLDKHIGYGRIFRLVYDGIKPRYTQPHMLEETTAQLVPHLTDPNGWWRDTAQKLIVLRGDKSVVPALKDMTLHNSDPLARLHALWTLDGLDSADAPLLLEKFKDADGSVRAAAVRISEPLLKTNDPAITSAVAAMATDPDPQVADQICLSMTYVKPRDEAAVVKATVAANTQNPAVGEIVQRVEDNASGATAEKEKALNLARHDPKLAALYVKGRDYYMQTCIACHGIDGKGTPAPEHNGTTIAPPLRGSKRLQGDARVVVRIAIHGLTGVNNGKTYTGAMVGFPWAPDDWLASILTYARNQWGNKAPAITPEEVAKIRKETEKRQLPYATTDLPDGKLRKGVH